MAQCMTPFLVSNKRDEKIPVPCGKCPACVARRASQWSFRLMQEGKKAITTNFITLTYATENVHITKNGFMDLDKRDLQLFFKRLRKRNITAGNTTKIVYYAVGEYGGKFKRPHYHIILFNADMATIQPAWELGQVHYGTVTGASIGYCLKYMTKLGMIPQHARDDRQKEFSLMSKGIGLNYLTENMTLWHLNKVAINERMYVTLDQGQKVSMPKYYKNKLYTEQQRKVAGAKSRIEQIKRQDKEIQLADYDYYFEQSRATLAAFIKMQHNRELNQIL